jgi:hypothetical protein
MSEMQGSAPAGNPAADAAGSGNAAPSGQQSGQSGQWYDAYPEEVRGTIQTKGWQSPADVIQSYTNLEKLLGADKAGRGVVLPKEDAPAEEWNQVYDKLGRPKTAADYKLPVPEGDTGEFAKMAAGKFHELGLTAKQAAGLAEWWNSQSQEMQTSQFNQLALNSEQEMGQLQQEWGKEYDANIEAARRATRQFGLEEQTLSKIENAIGTREMLKLFANIGKGVGEDSFVDGTRSSGMGMSPEAARVRISQLKADKEWSAKYLGGNADAKAELERLMRAAYPQ